MSRRGSPSNQSRLGRTTIRSERRLTDHDDLIESLVERARELNVTPTRDTVIDMLTHDEEAARTVDNLVTDRLAAEIKSRDRRTNRIAAAIFVLAVIIGVIATRLPFSWTTVPLHMVETIRSNIVLLGISLLWLGACVAVAWRDILAVSQKIEAWIHRSLARNAASEGENTSRTVPHSQQQRQHYRTRTTPHIAKWTIPVGPKVSPVLMVLSLLIAFSGLFLYQRISIVGQGGAIFEPDSAALISQSPEQVVAPGEHFSIQFTLKNSSRRPWNSQDGYALTCLSSCFNVNSVVLPDNQVVAPGKRHSFQISLIASQPLGLFQTRWVLTYQGQPFGPILTVPIDVVKQTIQIGWSTAYPTWIWMTVNNFSAGYYTYYCTFSTPPQSNGFSIHITSSPEHFDSKNTCYDSQAGDHVWVVINGVSSNTLTVP